MKVMTIKSNQDIPPEMHMEVHYAFKMEKLTDYVFKDKDAAAYSATISLKDSGPVIEMILRNSSQFPEYTFEVDDLDVENAQLERYIIGNGKLIEEKRASISWEK